MLSPQQVDDLLTWLRLKPGVSMPVVSKRLERAGIITSWRREGSVLTPQGILNVRWLAREGYC